MTPSQRHSLVRYGSRYGSAADAPPRAPTDRACPVCQTPVASGRARYCSDACKQHAYRLRHRSVATDDWTARRRALQRRRALVAQTVYECATCEARFVGDRRCNDCNRFCRALGPGGLCPHCDEPLTIAELLGQEVLPCS